MKKKVFIIYFLVIVLYCLSAPCAADVNNTCDNLEVSDENPLVLNSAEERCENSSVCDELSYCADNTYNSSCAIFEGSDDCDNLSCCEDVLGSNDEVNGPIFNDCRDYNELQTLLYAYSEVNLKRDYSINVDQTFNIYKKVVIDGHGHSINFNSKNSPYCIKSVKGDIVFKNIKICNGNCRDSGGALFIGGDAHLTLINCTFTGNHADKSGGAIFNSNKNTLKIIGCIFKDNHACDKSGAVYSRGDVEVTDSIFIDNSAGKQYGAIYCDGVLKFINSTATYNYANDNLNDQIYSKTGINDPNNFHHTNDEEDISNINFNQDSVNLWIKNSDELNKLLKYIKDNKLSCTTLNITLAPHTTFYVGHDGFEDINNKYAFRLNKALILINGNPGSVIHGDGNAFAYTTSRCNMGITNVIFENFNKCFVNSGTLYCLNSTFTNNNQVIENTNGVCFENCIFKGKSNECKYINAKYKSLTVLFDCKYVNWENSYIEANNQSCVVVFSEVPMKNTFSKSRIATTACFSIISTKTNGQNYTIYNCCDEKQLNTVVSTLNMFSPVKVAVINLEPKEYCLTCDTENKLLGNAYLCAGAIPIRINGNGATIKIDKKDYQFANIGLNGVLTVNNVTFSDFACVFANGGNLIVNNCSFINDHENIKLDHPVAMIWSKSGKNYITGCTFKNKQDSFNLEEGSELNLKDCDITDKNLGTTKDSTIYCPKEFMGKFKTEGNENYYHNNNIIINNSIFNPKGTVCVKITRSNYKSKLNEYLRDLSPANMLLNITCDCSIDLNDFYCVEKLKILANNHKVSFNPCTINKKISITIENLTLKNYHGKWIFENKGSMIFNNCCFKLNINTEAIIKNSGSCVFENCTFSSNYVKYIVDNEGFTYINNCSFNKNRIAKNDNGHCIFYNKGAILISNSTFKNYKSDEIIMNLNTGDYAVINSTGISEKYKLVKPETPKESKYKKKWLWFVLGAVIVVVGAVTGGIGYVVAASAGAAVGAAISIGITVGFVTAGIVAVVYSFIAVKETGVSLGVILPIYLSLALIGAVIGATGAHFLFGPAFYGAGAAGAEAGAAGGGGAAVASEVSSNAPSYFSGSSLSSVNTWEIENVLPRIAQDPSMREFLLLCLQDV